MTILLTGGAGFIGAATAERLLEGGERVILLDNFNDYYPVALKRDRIARLARFGDALTVHELDFSDPATVDGALKDAAFDRIVHLGAQAGVRYSLHNPMAYAASNLTGHLVVLELARHRRVAHMVYASSSSVYGNNAKVPFSVEDPVEHPISLYAATKRADELISDSYAHLYRTPLTGLRFFTVCGPWGRPDMMAWKCTEAVLAGRPIPVFNGGDMERDFTYIDDIVSGVIEQACGKKAVIDFQPMQAGDVPRTYADIDAIHRDLGYTPSTPIDVGIPAFVDWFRDYAARRGAGPGALT